MASSPHIICLGEALLDSLLPLGCDISSTPLDHCDNRLGGAPANVACALARLGSSVAFVEKGSRRRYSFKLIHCFRYRIPVASRPLLDNNRAYSDCINRDQVSS